MAHVRQAAAIGVPRGVARGARGILLGREPATIILHAKNKTGGVNADRNADLFGARVFDRIIQCFFERQKQVVAHLRSERPGRELHGHIEPALDMGGSEKILRDAG